MYKLILILSYCIAANCAMYTGPTNSAGVALIKSFESFVPNFYIDAVGIKTIGYGHACHANDCSVPINGKYPVPLSEDNGAKLLQDDLKDGGYEKCVTNNVKYSGLNANQYSALVSLVFNIGCKNFSDSTLLKRLNQGDISEASKQFGVWNKGGKPLKPLNGLTRRREAERVLFCTGGAC